MKKINVMLVISIVLMFVSCRHKYTYCLKNTNFSFTIENNDSEDVLVFGKEDSVFLMSLHGQYCTQVFFCVTVLILFIWMQIFLLKES